MKSFENWERVIGQTLAPYTHPSGSPTAGLLCTN